MLQQWIFVNLKNCHQPKQDFEKRPRPNVHIHWTGGTGMRLVIWQPVPKKGEGGERQRE
jgi:hypothetical protein